MAVTSALLWRQADQVLALSERKVAVCILPAAITLWIICIVEMFERPSTIAASRPWLRRIGQTITLFLPRDAAEDEANRIMQGCGETLKRVTEILAVDPLRFRVSVFLFPDLASFQAVSDKEETGIGGAAYSDGFATVFGPWDTIRDTVAHELTHVLAQQRMTANVAGLLCEGLAEYIAAEVRGDQLIGQVSLSSAPLRTLAFPEVFHDIRIARPVRDSGSHPYRQAHSFVRWLITQYGMTQFKQLYVATAGDYWRGCGKRLAKATKSVFGVPLSELEERWRAAEHAQGHDIKECGLTELAWNRFTDCAKRSLRLAEQEAIRNHDSVLNPDHILLGILRDTDSAAEAVLSRLGVSPVRLAERLEADIHGGKVESDVGLRIGPDANHVLMRAFGEARRLDESLVGSDHLLIGVLMSDRGAGCALLAEHGVTLERRRTAAEEIRTSTSPDANWTIRRSTWKS